MMMTTMMITMVMIPHVDREPNLRHPQVLLDSERPEDEDAPGLGLKLWLLDVHPGGDVDAETAGVAELPQLSVLQCCESQ